MFKSLFLLGGLVCSIGLGVNNVAVSNDLHYETNETIELKASPKLASYDDVNHSISLSADELNAYEWHNLSDYILDITNHFQLDISEYFQISYIAGLMTFEETAFNDDNSPLIVLYDADANHVYFDAYRFYLTLEGESNHSSFDDTLVIGTIAVSNYAGLKTAIELDISANSESMPQASDLFGYITQGATQFASALGQAFTSITAMIWDSTNSAPTFLGMVLLLSIGAGLIYLAFNIIRGLVRRLRG